MKKIIAAVLLIFILLSLSGCMSLSKELSQRGIVAAIGIDYSDGNYRLTLLILNADQASAEQNTYDVDYIRAEDEDLHQAFIQANKSTAKDLFYGHNGILVLSKSLMENKLEEALIYLAQSKETRLNVNVFMVNETAEEYITTKTSNKAHLSGTLEKVLTINYNGINIGVQMVELLCNYEQKGISGILPVIEKTEVQSSLTEGDENKEKIYDIEVRRLALLENNRIAGEVEGAVMEGILLMLNRIDSLDIRIENGRNERYYAQILEPKTTIAFDSQTKTILIDSHSSVSITGKMGSGKSQEIDMLKQEFEQDICRRIEAATIYCEQILGIDLFDMDWHIRQSCAYGESEILLNNPENMRYSVKCEVTISG